LKYLSVCSGIEAASVAWEGLKWEAAGFSEIEPFPCAVLNHHFPTVTNFGDLTKHEQWKIQPGTIDVICGGTPCQSFSVAGLRAGMADPRGNLALTFLSLCDRIRPEWIIWENVPGVLSSNGGRDFGAFLGALAQLGYGFAYRILDAQYFGVAQRRRRIFVVANARDWRRAAAVLFEPESLRGDSAPRRAKGQGITAGPSRSVDTICAAVTSKWAKGSGGPAGDECQNLVTAPPIVLDRAAPELPEIIGALCARDFKGVGSQYVNEGKAIPVPAPEPLAAIPINGMTINKELRDRQMTGIGEAGDPMFTIRAEGGQHAVAVGVDLFNNNTTGDIHVPLRTAGGHGAPAVLVSPPEPIAFHPTQDPISSVTISHCIGAKEYATCAVTVPAPEPFCKAKRAQSVDDDETWEANRPAPTLSVFDSGDTRATVAIVTPAPLAVRRLTPRECERLQGFPDDWTAIPYRGKPASDGPRYKAIGNSMAVPVMKWIGERIAIVDAATKEEV
jgi:DNA (cytosine-5)-methyltransferase 1